MAHVGGSRSLVGLHQYVWVGQTPTFSVGVNKERFTLIIAASSYVNSIWVQ